MSKVFGQVSRVDRQKNACPNLSLSILFRLQGRQGSGTPNLDGHIMSKFSQFFLSLSLDNFISYQQDRVLITNCAVYSVHICKRCFNQNINKSLQNIVNQNTHQHLREYNNLSLPLRELVVFILNYLKNTYLAKVDRSAQKRRGTPSSRPRRPFLGTLMAILDCTGRVVLKAVQHCMR